MPNQSITPATGKVVKPLKRPSDTQLEQSICLAATCYTTWRPTSFTERAVVAAKAAAILHNRVDEFALPRTLDPTS